MRICIEAGLYNSTQSGGSGDGGWWVAVLCENTGIELTQSGASLKRSVAFEQHQLFSFWSLSGTEGELKTAAGNTTPPYSVQDRQSLVYCNLIIGKCLTKESEPTSM